MKKLSIISILFLAAALLTSCSKESTISENVFVPPPSPALPSPQPVKVASQWFSPSFYVINDRSTVYLKAHQDYEAPLAYDRATYTELAFVKLNYQGTSIIRRLPVLLSCSHLMSNKLCEINFGLDNTGCDVIIRNADKDSSPVITTNPFPEMQIRYIVIPNTLFEGLSINWDDYVAVAQALNI